MSRADEILREKLLEQFEAFRVERILAEIKKEWVFDESVTEFGERLKEREQLKQATQVARATYVREHWTPSLYPQFTCEWFIEGLDCCWPSWRHECKKPKTPPPLKLRRSNQS